MMITKILQRVFLLIFIVVPVSVAADDDEFSQIVVFGDSLSDNGNLAAQTGFTFLSMPPFAGGLTNGFPDEDSFAVEVLARELGFDLLPAFAVPGGTNFAFAGALARVVDPPTPSFVDLREQVDAFLLGSYVVRPDALYVVFIGSNDVFDALTEELNPLSVVDPNSIIQMAVNEIIHAVERLSMAGANTIIVANVPDLAVTLRVRLMGAEATEEATRLTKRFNRRLSKEIDELDDEYDAEVIAFNVFRLVNLFVKKPAKFGFINTEFPCITGIFSCESSLFFDDFHPTARAHRFAGEKMLELVRDDDDDGDDDDDD